MAAIHGLDRGPDFLTPLLCNKANLVFVSRDSRSLIDLRALFCGKYTVFAATSGPQALEIVRNENIHVIAAEQSLAKMSGHELLRDVRKLSPHTSRLLFATGAEAQALGPIVREDEIFRVITKPWRPGELSDVIDNAVRIAQLSSDDASALSAQERPFGIVVLDDGGHTFRRVRGLCENKYSVLRARGFEQALNRLANDDVALLITDITLFGADTNAFFIRLNQQYPQLMTLAIAPAEDSETAMELVNQGYIYRYLRRPVNDSLLGRGIRHGIRFYAMNKIEPASTPSDNTAGGGNNADTGASPLNRLLVWFGLRRSQVRLSTS